MSFSHGSKAGLYVNGYDWTSYFRSIALARTVDVPDASVFGTLAKAYQPNGIADATLSAEGFFDGTTTPTAANDKFFSDQLGSETKMVLCYPPCPQAIGSPMYGMQTDEASLDESAATDGLVSLDAEFQASGGAERCIILKTLGQVTGNGNGSGFDLSTVDGTAGPKAFGGVGYLQETQASGSSCQVKVQHSVDNAAWVDLVTFTARTTIGAERVAVAGTVNRWVRFLHTVPSGSMTYTVAFKRFIQ